MTEYEKHLQQRGLVEYILDGAINPAKWVESKVRVLFLLKETYGYQGCGIIKIEECAPDWLDANIKTYLKAVPLAAAIEIGFQRGCPLSPEEINLLSKNRKLLHETLNKMAFVNIKKHSGKSTSDDKEIREESCKNAPLLHAQIRDLSPTVIVAGGNVCWDCLIDDLNLFGAVRECGKFEAILCNHIILCRSNHPSAWSGGGFDIHALHCAILSANQPRPNLPSLN